MLDQIVSNGFDFIKTCFNRSESSEPSGVDSFAAVSESMAVQMPLYAMDLNRMDSLLKLRVQRVRGVFNPRRHTLEGHFYWFIYFWRYFTDDSRNRSFGRFDLRFGLAQDAESSRTLEYDGKSFGFVVSCLPLPDNGNDTKPFS